MLKRNGFAFGVMVISTAIVSKFRHNTRSDFIIDRVSNKYRYCTMHHCGSYLYELGRIHLSLSHGC